MAGGGSQNSLRKYLGALKDSTTVGLAKVNSDYKELDVAIVKATNHVERPAKEKHIKAIFAAISASRPRADVAYCIHALARRLSKTHNWAVALKTLTVIHRALREVDPTFREELINYGRTRNHLLNLSHFKDDSSQQAWEYSAWLRSYALFLEEKLECCRVLKYDIETEPSKTRDLDTIELLEQLPALQQLLFRLLGCQPQGSFVYNLVIHPALSMVAGESIKLYNAIDNGTINLVDKFFEMQRHDAVKALEIYRKAGQQVERLSEFYEVCKSFDVRRGEGFIKIEQAPASFLTAMEEYVKDTPQKVQAKEDAPKVILAIEYNKPTEVPETPKEVTEPPPEEAAKPPSPPPEPAKVESSIQESNDLLGLSSDANPVASELDSKNAMALAILPTDNVSSAPPTSFPEGGTTGWELALVTAPSSNESAATNSMLGGRLDRLTLDSLYDDHDRRINQPTSYDPWQPPASGSGYPMQHPASQDPFHGSSNIAAPINVQTAMLAQQQQASMLQQQQHMMMNNQQPLQPQANPFGDYNQVGLSQTPNSYGGLI